MTPEQQLGAGGDGPKGSAPPAGAQPGGATTAPLVVATGISKTFGAVQALRDVDIEIASGEIHGLIGANGAGKSTLIRVLAGVIQPDEGTLLVDGEETEIAEPRQSADLGFQFLHQELNLVPKFSTLENMSLGLIGRTKLGFADRGPVFRRAREVAEEIGLEFSLNRPVAELSVAQQWLVALGRSLMRKARLIAFDEPTASLSAEEAETLFTIIRRMSADGIAVLYVSHRLEEIERLSDRVTGFREGRVVAEFKPHQINRKALIEAITGGEAEAVSVPQAAVTSSPGEVILEARNIVSLPAVRDVSLTLRAGEVVGMAGLVGAGRTELARILFGADEFQSGQIFVDGKEVRLRSPSDANRLGIGLVPEERRSEALFLDKDATFNVNVATGSLLRVGPSTGPISMRIAKKQAKEIAARVDLRPPNVDATVRTLSGGNQQKLAVGRWLLGKRRILMLDEPTRGVDIGARAQIHRMLRELAEGGMGILVISSDFEELLSCDRVLVMNLGKIVAELRQERLSMEQMLRAAYNESTDDPSRSNALLPDG